MLKRVYILGALIPIFIGCSSNESSIGVVDLPKLYAGFEYQNELNAEFEKAETAIHLTKDSLTVAMKTIEFSLSNSVAYSEADKGVLFERAYSNYLDEQEYLDFKIDSISDMFSTKVWKQLNSYVQEYGAENNYDVIIGMQGNGNVMYTKENLNLTEDVLEYANKKYHGE